MQMQQLGACQVSDGLETILRSLPDRHCVCYAMWIPNVVEMHVSTHSRYCVCVGMRHDWEIRVCTWRSTFCGCNSSDLCNILLRGVLETTSNQWSFSPVSWEVVYVKSL
jgi:hypothetical protein